MNKPLENIVALCQDESLTKAREALVKSYEQHQKALEDLRNAVKKSMTAAMEKAGLDKKNKDDGNVVMSVAKAYGEWTLLSLPMDAYVSALQNAINKL